MKIYELADNERLWLAFEYNNKKYELELKLFKKFGNSIMIPAVLSKLKPVAPKELLNPELLYKTSSGVYTFDNLNLEFSKYCEQNVYLASSESSPNKVNKRENFRTFIGDIVHAKFSNNRGDAFTTQVILKDLSATGMGLMATLDLQEYNKVEIMYEVVERCSVNLIGNIVRTEKLNTRHSFLYGCCFTQRSEILGKYVLRRQMLDNMKNKALSISKLSQESE